MKLSPAQLDLLRVLEGGGAKLTLLTGDGWGRSRMWFEWNRQPVKGFSVSTVHALVKKKALVTRAQRVFNQQVLVVSAAGRKALASRVRRIEELEREKPKNG